jgi:hypothetical protein
MRRDLGLVGADRRLFGLVVNAMPFDNDLRFGPAKGTMHNLAAGPVEDLALGVRDFSDGTGMRLECDGNPALYSAAELTTHLARISHLLDQVLADPEVPLGRVRLGPRARPRPWPVHDPRLLPGRAAQPHRVHPGRLLPRADLLAGARS